MSDATIDANGPIPEVDVFVSGSGPGAPFDADYTIKVVDRSVDPPIRRVIVQNANYRDGQNRHPLCPKGAATVSGLDQDVLTWDVTVHSASPDTGGTYFVTIRIYQGKDAQGKDRLVPNGETVNTGTYTGGDLVADQKNLTVSWGRCMRTAALCVGIVCFLVGHAVIAEGETVADTSIDLSVPDSPAFAVLGVTPQSVIHPSTPNDVATHLLNGVDENGNFQTGLAIATKPYSLWWGRDLDIVKYLQNPEAWNSRRLLSRTEVSLATAKGVNDADKRTRLAVGVRATPWDEGDPHMDDVLSQCFHQYAVTNPPPDQPVPPLEPSKRKGPDGKPLTPAEIQALQPAFEMAQQTFEAQKQLYPTLVDAYNAGLKKHDEKCRADAKKRNWNRSSWGFGVAPAWGSKTGNTNDIRWDGIGAWTSLAYGFEQFTQSKMGDDLLEWLLHDHSQLILHARYRTDELIPDPNVTSAFFKQDSVAVGGRLRIGTENGGFSGELLYLRDMPKGTGREDKNDYRVSLAGEIKLFDKLWLELSVGQKGPRPGGGKDQGFVLSALKWGFSAEPKNVAQ
jgi:hypothetical protein